MSFEEAIALQPTWVGIWLNILLFGAFVLPLALFIWRPTRLLAFACLVASGLSALAITYMYNSMGYVRLLGLPHVIFWTPLAFYLFRSMRKPDVSRVPQIIIGVILATITISLAFDYVDTARYILGERTPSVLPPAPV